MDLARFFVLPQPGSSFRVFVSGREAGSMTRIYGGWKVHPSGGLDETEVSAFRDGLLLLGRAFDDRQQLIHNSAARRPGGSC